MDEQKPKELPKPTVYVSGPFLVNVQKIIKIANAKAKTRAKKK